MKQEIAEKIGLLRHKIISPVLMENGRNQMEYFRRMEGQEFYVPGIGHKKFKATTMKGWLNKYRKYGFKALTPKKRADSGIYRKLTPEVVAQIKSFREKNIDLPTTLFYDLCIEKNILASKMVCYATFARFIKKEGLTRKRVSVPRKKYEMDHFGELWTLDFCHGPLVLVPNGKRKRKAILLAIVDDHSRYIVGAKFSFFENTMALEEVFKEAVLAFGFPGRIYVDNGSAFSSKYLEKVCANSQVGLVHSKPYDSPSRGKIERFFRTVRDRFLIKYKNRDNLTLEELDDAFVVWLRDDYHFKKHSSIKARPYDRYQQSIENFPLRRASREEIDIYFLVSIQRTVRKDSTVAYGGIFYEVPANYIGQRVELRHEQGDKTMVYLYENDIRICEIKPVDSRANAKSYRPGKRENILTMHNEEDSQ